MHKERFASAARGLLITLMVPAAITLLQIALAPWIVRYGSLSDAWMYVGSFRKMVLDLQSGAGLLVLGYWLAMAIFCRGDMLRIGSANACLLLSGLTFETAMLLACLSAAKSLDPEPLCAALGVSEPSQITYGFDPISRCDLFLMTWAPPIFFGLPVALLLASALLRIFVSRYRHARTQPPSA